jgi:prophage DNA circulation protein
VTAIALGAVQDAQTDGTTTAATTTTTTGATTSAPAPLPPTPTTPATGPDGGPLPNNGTLPEAVAAIAKLAVGGTIPVAVTPTGPIAALLTPGGAALAQQQAAAAALLQMTQILLIVAACDAAARVDYPSAQSALAMRQTLGDVLDEIVLGVEDEDLYASLMNLEAAVWQHLTVTASGLPSVATYTPPRMLPMLAIAQQVYGDARMEGQILVENDVANPARVPGGVALEVLSDAA